jgi:hypothetical protein
MMLMEQQSWQVRGNVLRLITIATGLMIVEVRAFVAAAVQPEPNKQSLVTIFAREREAAIRLRPFPITRRDHSGI